MTEYNIIESTVAGIENGLTRYRVVIGVDTEDDLPEPDASWAADSLAFIRSTHSVKVLNSEGAWI